MLVRIEKDWDFPDIMRQSPGGGGVWDDITFTCDPVRVCDVLVVFNQPAREIRVKCPPGNKWLFSQESPIDMYRWQLKSFGYFDKVFTFWDKSISRNIIHDQTALPWHIGKTYDQLTALTYEQALIRKKNRISWVTSNACHKEGHKLRMMFKDYLESVKFDYDLFGRGFNPIPDKFDGIFPYKYSIAIENYSCNDYWTEKISDCFLSWTIPVYWGAKNILSYFPSKSIVHIDPEDGKGTRNILRGLLENGYYENCRDALAEARNLVLNRYQFFPHIRNLIEKYSISGDGQKVACRIPANRKRTRKFNARTVFRKLKRIIYG